MAARIFTCHHIVPPRIFRPNRLFSMLISGEHSNGQAGYLGDLDGDNIAGRNVYSELRHQYYVWRNLLGRYDYVGFEHYRRVFFIDPAPAAIARAGDPQRWWWRTCFQAAQNAAYADTTAEGIEDYFTYRSEFNLKTCQTIESWMAHYDIIVQRPFMHDGLEAQWKSCQPPHVWDVILAAVREALAASGAGDDIDGNIGVSTGYFNNMYIMRSEIFDEYMKFYMHCADLILQRATSYQRMLGHCGERIFSLWLYQRCLDNPLLKVHQLPFLYGSDAIVANLPSDYRVGGQAVLPAAGPWRRKGIRPRQRMD